MKSLATVITYQIEEANNEEVFEKTLLMLYPELYQIHTTLEETNINPAVLPKIIRGLRDLVFSGGWGTLKVHMQKKTITNIEAEGSLSVDMPATTELKIYTTSDFIEVTELDNSKKQE